MKTCKAAGIDDISMELIQHLSTELQDELFKLMNVCIHYERDPQSFQGEHYNTYT
jgi:hypothetical protein